MANVKTVSFAGFVVRSEDNSVDIEASVAKFQEEFEAWLADSSSSNEAIETAIHKAFDAPGGNRDKDGVKFITLPDLAGLVWKDLGSPGLYTEAIKSVKEVIDNNPIFASRKGRTGGVIRLAPVVLADK
jgi:hypothetical protein